jgi:hypothetical protein
MHAWCTRPLPYADAYCHLHHNQDSRPNDITEELYDVYDAFGPTDSERRRNRQMEMTSYCKPNWCAAYVAQLGHSSHMYSRRRILYLPLFLIAI